MASDIKYNVYYSFSSNGPWTLANIIPIEHNNNGMNYCVEGLKKGGIYYFRIIGGKIESDKFIPLVTQSIGPINETAQGVNTSTALSVVVKNTWEN